MRKTACDHNCEECVNEWLIEGSVFYAPAIDNNGNLRMVLDNEPYATFSEAEKHIEETMQYFDEPLSKVVIICFKKCEHQENAIDLISVYSPSYCH